MMTAVASESSQKKCYSTLTSTAPIISNVLVAICLITMSMSCVTIHHPNTVTVNATVVRSGRIIEWRPKRLSRDIYNSHHKVNSASWTLRISANITVSCLSDSARENFVSTFCSDIHWYARSATSQHRPASVQLTSATFFPYCNSTGVSRPHSAGKIHEQSMEAHKQHSLHSFCILSSVHG